MIKFLLIFLLNGTEQAIAFPSEEMCKKAVSHLIYFYPREELEITSACLTYEEKK